MNLAAAFLLATLAQSGGQDADASEDEPFLLHPLASPARSGEASGMPHLCSGADGKLYLSWLQLEDAGRATLLFSELGETGWGAAREIARGDDWFLNWADFPSLTAHSNGVLLAHWLERIGEGTYAYGIRYALSPDGGRTWDPPSWLHDDLSPKEHGFASFVPIGEEGFAALWLDGRAMESGHGDEAGHGSGAMQVRFRTVGLDGSLGPEQLLDERSCECCPTHLVKDGAGDLFAVWRDRTEDETRDIAYCSSSPPYASWSNTAIVFPDDWTLPGCPVNGPRLVARPSGARVLWFTGAGGGAGSVRTLLLREPRQPPFSPTPIDNGAPVGRVDLAPHSSGQTLLWLGVEEGRGAWYLRHLDATGTSSDPFVLVDVPAGRASGHARIAALPGTPETVVVAWTDPDAHEVRTARVQLAPRAKVE